MDDIIKSIDELLAQIATKAAVKESMESYLQNNLRDYKSVLQVDSTPQDIENATRALTRFCTESMDWENPLYRKCCDITARGMKLSKR